MICLNCGRPNPSGTALCSRCRQRRPGLERARGGVIYQRTRETARVGNRGPNILALGVIVLAALIFAGGTLAVFMGPRNESPSTDDLVAGVPGLATPRLEIFEQETLTPSPTPTPVVTASPLLSASLSPSPSLGFTFNPVTPTPTPGSVATPRPTPKPTKPPPATPPPDSIPRAKFSANQQDSSTRAKFNDNSTGGVVAWFWQFEGGATSTERNPTHDFGSYGTKSVTLTVTDADGDTDSVTKTITLQEATPTPDPGTPTPDPGTPTPTPPESPGPPSVP